MSKLNIIKIAILVSGILLLVLTGGTCYASYNCVSVNGVVINNLDTLPSKLIELVNKTTPVFKDSRLNDFIEYKFDVSEIYNRSIIERVIDGFTGKNYEVGFTYTVDEEGLRNYLTTLNNLSIKSEDAFIIKGNDCFSIVEETYGTQVDIDKLVSDLDSIRLGFILDNYFIQPVVKSTDLRDIETKLNDFVAWTCTYNNGVVIKSSIDYVNYVDGNITLDISWLTSEIDNLYDVYYSVGNNREFLTSSGEKIQLSGGTWGSKLNKVKELEFVTDAFTNCEVFVNRLPEYSIYQEDIGTSYIELDIDKQYLWVYKDGTLVMETDVVTGTYNKNDTPKGIYFISERINGKYLRGDGYKTWVDKWMRITSRGHGLHDASWRNSFGGEIYKTDGSHGCINLPKDFAYSLYDITYVGMPVIIY